MLFERVIWSIHNIFIITNNFYLSLIKNKRSMNNWTVFQMLWTFEPKFLFIIGALRIHPDTFHNSYNFERYCGIYSTTLTTLCKSSGIYSIIS